MFCSQNSSNSSPDQPTVKPAKSRSLAAHFDTWYHPERNVYSISLKAVVEQAAREDTEAAADFDPFVDEYHIEQLRGETFEFTRVFLDQADNDYWFWFDDNKYTVESTNDDWRTIGDDEPKPAPKSCRVTSLEFVLVSKDNPGFKVNVGDVVNVLCETPWGLDRAKVCKVERDGMIAWVYARNLEAVA